MQQPPSPHSPLPQNRKQDFQPMSPYQPQTTGWVVPPTLDDEYIPLSESTSSCQPAMMTTMSPEHGMVRNEYNHYRSKKRSRRKLLLGQDDDYDYDQEENDEDEARSPLIRRHTRKKERPRLNRTFKQRYLVIKQEQQQQQQEQEQQPKKTCTHKPEASRPVPPPPERPCIFDTDPQALIIAQRLHSMMLQRMEHHDAPHPPAAAASKPTEPPPPEENTPTSNLRNESDYFFNRFPQHVCGGHGGDGGGTLDPPPPPPPPQEALALPLSPSLEVDDDGDSFPAVRTALLRTTAYYCAQIAEEEVSSSSPSSSAAGSAEDQQSVSSFSTVEWKPQSCDESRADSSTTSRGANSETSRASTTWGVFSAASSVSQEDTTDYSPLLRKHIRRKYPAAA